ncbi:3-deoxy-manno-octulosonate cytidylyltransferase [Rhodohalobacter barkolensis]|uniref:3-deoxy-manno-octulosonate cytidylyltransferase n=1 Tax=Rhodohalobacter barkolensis TaxID=2053187 RepID=A0A2N0VGH1_9BACT|nr:3-deoxy-manno-octulosonate cytidylyltransferase [Rhodohalobacter barkolensis]PKD43274.1 3-deoxy-manno-octulosonate cytidylyltransferase [Rhodohalobacter barkolensis]
MNLFHITAIIPARYQSSRLPYKILHKLDGKSMLQWVHERASQSEGIDEVVIATDHELIQEEAERFGATAMMTSADHQSGTDRIAEAAEKFPDADVFVNVQGDQPFLESSMIEKLIEPYRLGLEPDMATLACPLDQQEIGNPNTVKVAVNRKNIAMFFTRSPIPYFRNQVEDLPVYQHVGLYAYSAAALQKISRLNASKLELAEGLEQMRALEEGLSIYVSTYDKMVPEINTLEDLEKAQEMGLIDNYTLYNKEE